MVREAKKHGTPLYITHDESGHPLNPTGFWFASGDDSNESEDFYDLAVLRFDVDTVPCLANKSFLRLHDISTERETGNDIYCVLGFPSELATSANFRGATLSLTPLEYFATQYDEYVGNLPNFDPNTHILIDATRNLMRDVEGVKRLDGFPKELNGISGASIWKTNALNVPIEHWTPQLARIIAVQTRVYRKDHSIIKGTRWTAVEKMLYSAIPEIRPALGLKVFLRQPDFHSTSWLNQRHQKPPKFMTHQRAQWRHV